MFKHFNKIALRNLVKYRFFTTINVLGLSVAISICMLIGMYVVDELSYETSYPKHENIYRVNTTNWAKSAPLLGIEFKERMPEVTDVARIFNFETMTALFDENQILIERPILGDPSVLEIFNMEFIEGTPDALDKPSSIVLTESTADRLFKKGQNRVGEVIDLDNGWFVTVTGIVKDPPKNTHLQFDCIASSRRSRIMNSKDRLWAGVSIYALFDSKEGVERVNEKLMDFHVEFLEGVMTKEEILASKELLELTPITDIHLHSHREKELSVNSDIKVVYLFASLGIFILLVSIINFVNLNMAQSLNRIKEVAVRKIIGSTRKQLIFQFLLEVTFLLLLSTCLGLALTTYALPFYNELALIPITVAELLSINTLAITFLLPLVTGWLASFFISSYMMSFNLSQASGGKNLSIGNRFSIRKSMMGVQFLISTFLLIATLIINRQITFINSQDLGFARDEVIAIKLQSDLKFQAILSSSTIASELKKLPKVSDVSYSSHLIGSRISIEPFYLKNSPEHSIGAPRVIAAGPHFLETMGITLLEGEVGAKRFGGSKYVVNETAANWFRKDDLLGEIGVNTFRDRDGEIVGIINDFHFASLHHEVEPLIIQLSLDDQNSLNYLLVRFQSSKVSETIEHIEETLRSIAPDAPLAPLVLSDHMNVAYEAEGNMFKVLKTFSSIGISLALVGMFALFTFNTRLRIKEMGIRKTLGASSLQLVTSLSKSYVLLVGMVTLLALPIASAWASNWLQDFAYQVPIKWWYFAIPAAAVLTLTIGTIVVQALKIARINPVESLKTE